jgi:competence protein ComEA
MKARIAIALAAVLWLVAADASTSARAVQRGALPPAEGRDTVMTVCGDCHEAEVMAAQRRSRIEWETLIEDMTSRNGAATEDDKKIIVGYALRHFGRVNVNTGTADDIVQIVQLTPAEAAAIVSYRQQAGEFKSLDDLRKVPDLDFARIQERKDRIGFTGP